MKRVGAIRLKEFSDHIRIHAVNHFGIVIDGTVMAVVVQGSTQREWDQKRLIIAVGVYWARLRWIPPHTRTRTRIQCPWVVMPVGSPSRLIH